MDGRPLGPGGEFALGLFDERRGTRGGPTTG